MVCKNKTYQADNTIIENGGVRIVECAGGPVPSTVQWERVKQAVLNVHPHMPEDELDFYLGVMTLDEATFLKYAKLLEIENPETLARDFSREQQNNERARLRQVLEVQKQNAYKQIGMQFISEKWENIARSHRQGRDFSEACQILWDRYGITVEVKDRTDFDQAHEQLSWLLNLLDHHPVLHQMVKQGKVLKRVMFRDINPDLYNDHAKTTYNDLHRMIEIIENGLYSPTTWVHEIGHSIPVDTKLFGVERSASSYLPENFDEDCAEWFTAIAGENDVEGLAEWHPGKFEYILDHVPGLREFLKRGE